MRQESAGEMRLFKGVTHVTYSESKELRLDYESRSNDQSGKSMISSLESYCIITLACLLRFMQDDIMWQVFLNKPTKVD